MVADDEAWNQISSASWLVQDRSDTVRFLHPTSVKSLAMQKVEGSSAFIRSEVPAADARARANRVRVG